MVLKPKGSEANVKLYGKFYSLYEHRLMEWMTENEPKKSEAESMPPPKTKDSKRRKDKNEEKEKLEFSPEAVKAVCGALLKDFRIFFETD